LTFIVAAILLLRSFLAKRPTNQLADGAHTYRKCRITYFT